MRKASAFLAATFIAATALLVKCASAQHGDADFHGRDFGHFTAVERNA